MIEATMIEEDYLAKLNEEQTSAVIYGDGPLLVLAGAGTGKTRVLTTRIAHIIASNKAYPSQILAVTFTNKAAKEILERTNRIINADGIWSGTFHSLAAKILRIHGSNIGLTSSFTIVDSSDQLRLIENLLEYKKINNKKFPAKAVLNSIQRFKDLAKMPIDVEGRDLKTPLDSIAREIYAEYNHQLFSSGAVDFGDLLLLNIKLFQENPDILDYYQQKFKYVLVDEYQDTNYAQYLWLMLLVRKYRNITCVGDDDQAIYSWRGATVENILRFEHDFPDAYVIRLEKNYRSSDSIINVAASVISNNDSRLGKTLWTDKTGLDKVKIIQYHDDKHEAHNTASIISNLYSSYDRPSEVAVLLRAGYLTRQFEDAFRNYNLSYKIIGGVKFYERLEVKDTISYLRLCYNSHDNLAFERVINVPKRGIGHATMLQLRQYSMSNSCSMFDAAIAFVNSGEVKGKAKTSIAEFVNIIKNANEKAKDKHHVEVAADILRDSGYLDMWKNEKSFESEGRVENIEELIKVLSEYPSLAAFIEHINLVSDVDNMDDKAKINIMTIHAAKGLEFDTVFLPAWEEEIFPSGRSLSENGLEEERRLAYVAITRAKTRLYISFCRNRSMFSRWQQNDPSRFLMEIPKSHVEIIKK